MDVAVAGRSPRAGASPFASERSWRSRFLGPLLLALRVALRFVLAPELVALFHVRPAEQPSKPDRRDHRDLGKWLEAPEHACELHVRVAGESHLQARHVVARGGERRPPPFLTHDRLRPRQLSASPPPRWPARPPMRTDARSSATRRDGRDRNPPSVGSRRRANRTRPWPARCRRRSRRRCSTCLYPAVRCSPIHSVSGKVVVELARDDDHVDVAERLLHLGGQRQSPWGWRR